MSRITVEDCLENVDNRFGLVLIAAKRARLLALGSEAQLEWQNDKPTLVALREIAAGKIGAEVLNEPIVELNHEDKTLPPIEDTDLDSDDFQGPDPEDDEDELEGAEGADTESTAAAPGASQDTTPNTSEATPQDMPPDMPQDMPQETGGED